MVVIFIFVGCLRLFFKNLKEVIKVMIILFVMNVIVLGFVVIMLMGWYREIIVVG